MNLANALTILRIILVPFFVYFLIQPEASYKLVALIMFVVASLTDLVDGYVARKLNQETELGKFLDPLADKMLVISSLLIFILLEEQIQMWMVFVIIGRDMMVTLMRYIAIRKGNSLKTSKFGKVKTAFQMISIVIILLIFAVRRSGVAEKVNHYYSRHSEERILEKGGQTRAYISLASEKFVEALHDKTAKTIPETVGLFSYSLPYFLMLATALLTAFSGFRYLYTNWRLLLPPYPMKKPKSE